MIALRATENSGVAFGIGADLPLAIVATLITIAVIAMGRRLLARPLSMH